MIETTITNGELTSIEGESQESYQIPEGVIRIKCRGSKCKVRELRFPSSLRWIDSFAFADNEHIESVDLSECTSLTYLEDYVFKNCKSLKSVFLPHSLEEIRYSTFARCSSLQEIELPYCMWRINSDAFEDCISLRHIKFNDALKEIGYDAFANCRLLQRIDIPASCTRISGYSFKGCSSLSKVVIYGKPSISDTAFIKCASLKEIVLQDFEPSQLYTTFSGAPLERIVLVNNRKTKILKTSEIRKELENKFKKFANGFCKYFGLTPTKIRGELDVINSFKNPAEKYLEGIENSVKTDIGFSSFWENDWHNVTGIGTLLGITDIHALDIDNILSNNYHDDREVEIKKLASECLDKLGLPQDYPWVVRSGSGNGFHIIFRTENLKQGFTRITYCPNDDYSDYSCNDIEFKRMELFWNDHLVLPPSIHATGKQYKFLNGGFPRIGPTKITLKKLDETIHHFCGQKIIATRVINGKKCELAEYRKYNSSVDSYGDRWGYKWQKDSTDWLLKSGSTEAINSLIIDIIVEKSNKISKEKIFNILSKFAMSDDFALFNLASLTAIGYFNGSVSDVNSYLLRIKNKQFFEETESKDEEDNWTEFKDHFQLIKENALKHCSNEKRYLFFDTETTGIAKNRNAPSTDLHNWPRLVQLAWVIVNENGEIVKEVRSSIIKPEEFVIPEEASRIHGITQTKANREGEQLLTVLREFCHDIGRCNIYVGHNISFDIKVVASELFRMGAFKAQQSFEAKQSICTMNSSVDFCKISGPYGYKYPKLQELHLKLFGFGFENEHDASADIMATVKCFFELKKRGIIE